MIILFLAGCSEKEADEIIEVNNDFKEYVDDPVGELMDELEQKSFEVDNGEMDPNQLMSFIEDELEPRVDEMKSYVEDYDEPSTDDAKELYSEMKEYSNLSFESVDSTVELIKGILDDSVSETDIYYMDKKIEEILAQANQKLEKIEELQIEYGKEYNLEFNEDTEEE